MSYTPFKMKGPSLLKMVKEGKKAKKYGLAENLQEAKGTEFLDHEKRVKENEEAAAHKKAHKKAVKGWGKRAPIKNVKKGKPGDADQKGLADDGRTRKNLRILELDRNLSGKSQSDKFKTDGYHARYKTHS